ncbi:MAG: hypothetical protein M0Z63_03490 [Actinomycetota bacterium]|jgi:hypothetical protein|nr:hypothetical protein [Actinomycetota bacterium]MDA8279475.1 hypothetical protein [Actinomycetota bacterium]
MTAPAVLDDQALRRYRELLDAEDAAFDELEHACEEGDRGHFEADFDAWQRALTAKLEFLRRVGIDIPQAAAV